LDNSYVIAIFKYSSLKKGQKMKKLFYLALVALAIGSCKKDNTNNSNNNTVEQGTVTGTVYSANGLKTVANAKVSMDGSTQYQTVSDAKGKFSITCPVGLQHFTVSVGNSNIFKGGFTATVEVNKSLEEPHDSTVLEQEKQLAYVAGYWDSIQNIIRDSLGYTMTELSDADLTIGNLNNYAIIFLNCGAPFHMNTAIYSNLDAYLQAGGNIYASDFAIDFLVGDGYLKKPHSHSNKAAAAMTPCSNPQLGGFIEDSLLCHEKVGLMMPITGTVVDPTMQNFFGQTVNLNYNLDGWAQLFHVETNDPRFKVLINDPVTYGPLLVSIKWGAGAQGGNIMYTTFHNEANVTPDMVNLLQWIVFNY
jgi:hypothetical protein